MAVEPVHRGKVAGWADDGWRLGYRPGLDHLRAVAVILVLLQHGFPYGRVGLAGTVGVTVFFVLSGFLITRLLIEERMTTRSVDLVRFYGRRARRLLPPLVPTILLGVLAHLLTGGALLEPVVASLLYVANYASAGDPSWGVFSHLWSLAVEEHFYLAWPAMVAFLPRRAVLAIAPAGAVIVAVARFVEGPSSLTYRATHFRIDALLLGALLALFVTSLRRPPPWLAAVAVAALAMWVPHSMAEQSIQWGIGITALSAGVLVLFVLDHERRIGPLAHIGAISYALYLFHLPVFAIVRVGMGLRGVAAAIVAVAITFVLAQASYVWIELPLRSRSRRPAGVVTTTP